MKYYLIAGEASGDLHASNLMKALAAADPEAEFRFRGGALMEEAGRAARSSVMVCDYRQGAAMGLTDLFLKSFRLLTDMMRCRRDILKWNPDVVIPVDYPGFNLRIASFCHSRGIRVFYYIAPKTWASRSFRNKTLRKCIDRLYIVFPFEVPYFESKRVPCTYLGNPLKDEAEGRKYEPVNVGEPYVALLPGSRKEEISRMMPVWRDAARRLGRKVVIAGAPGRSVGDCLGHIGPRDNVKILFGRTYDILRYADAAIINSGTASLEAVFTGTPQVVCWSNSWLTLFVARHILKVQNRINFISLGNLIAGRRIFRELIQEDFTARNLVKEVGNLLDNKEYRDSMLEGYRDIISRLGEPGAPERIAGSMIGALSGK
ncbi:MAG: lipid-A-disaccharide synthase [Bacteroidales bacterium]|nr:lipid-A-disaccharide synthase [Bacteroidales bacterium]